MIAAGFQVAEEEVMDELLADLAAPEAWASAREPAGLQEA
jgi:hypothetical protein